MRLPVARPPSSIILLCLVFASCSAPAAQPESHLTSEQTSDAPQLGQHPHTFEGTATKRLGARYLLFLPREYGTRDTRWPLILYLHGGSLRGDNVDTVRTWGVPRVAERDPSFPFIVLAPQAPAGTLWTDADLLIELLDEVIARYAVDPERVYLTGHSMGGNGTWYLAYLHPERFAAIAPMSAPANPWWATRLREVPTWVFHGADDKIVPVRESQEMVGALRANGAAVEFTVLPNRDHGILDVYDDPELYDWFLRHRRLRSPSGEWTPPRPKDAQELLP